MHLSISVPTTFVLLLAGAAAQNQQVTLTTSKDNTLYEDAAGGLSNGAGSRTFAGNTGQFNETIRRGLLAFDVAAVVPRRSTIVSATLTLECTMSVSGATAIDLHRLLGDWGEGTSIAGMGQGGGAAATTGDATWLHRFWNTQNWQTAGGDFNAAVSGTTMVSATGSYTWASTTQMVADVQQWLDNPAANFGWMLRGDEANPRTAKAFDTKESTTPAQRPQLTIVYTPPSASVTSVGSGCSAGAPTPLALTANGLPQVPNPTFGVTMSGGPTGPHVLFIALQTLPAGLPIGNNCFVHINPLTLVVTLSAATGPFPMPVPNNATLLGLELALQAAAVNPANVTLATSNALSLVLGT